MTTTWGDHTHMHKIRWAAACGLVVLLLATACGRSGSDTQAEAGTPQGTSEAWSCEGQTLEATDVGVSADTITIETLADVGSPLAPGLFQANLDAVRAFAEKVNASGGLAC